MPRSAVSSASESAPRLLLATRSPGKVREIRALVAAIGFEVIDLRQAKIPESEAEDTLERFSTYEENALAKARHFHRLSGMPTIADDSGLEVFALENAPGVHSKRWSERRDLTGAALDEANNALLLRRLSDSRDRAARYVCVAAYCDDDVELIERGEVLGAITERARGTSGFGYDPYFESFELGRTFGQATLEEKSRVSHRARAFGKLLERLASRG
jgi:XTP/dITP diphosphohydrolase